MKIALFAAMFLLFFMASGQGKENSNNEFRHPEDLMRENGISAKDLCKIACESHFARCYNQKRQSGFKCAAKALICKQKCTTRR